MLKEILTGCIVVDPVKRAEISLRFLNYPFEGGVNPCEGRGPSPGMSYSYY